MNLENPFFLTLVLSGVSFIVSGIIMLKYPPKKINGFYGYRTSKSMKNQKAWDFSQLYASELMVKYGIIMCLLSLFGFFNIITISVFNMFFSIGILIVLCVLLIVQTELALKKNEHSFLN